MALCLPGLGTHDFMNAGTDDAIRVFGEITVRSEDSGELLFRGDVNGAQQALASVFNDEILIPYKGSKMPISRPVALEA